MIGTDVALLEPSAVEVAADPAQYGELDQETAVVRLSNLHGGVNGLLGRAEQLRQQTGNVRGHCVAAAAVDVINKGRGGKKLPSWWRASAESLAASP